MNCSKASNESHRLMFATMFVDRYIILGLQLMREARKLCSKCLDILLWRILKYEFHTCLQSK